MATLNSTEENLLNLTVTHSIEELVKDKSIAGIQQLAFDGFDAESNEQFQVQIIVTRSKRDFLEPLVTCIISDIN